MSFLAPKTAKPAYTGLQIQTSVSVLPIPIAYGLMRFAPNLIWSGDFASHASKQQGGKGGRAGTTNVYYTSSVIFGLCEGIVGGIGNVWRSSGGGSPNDMESLAAAGLLLIAGAAGQAPWGYLTAAHPSQALPYPSTAYLCAPNYDLGSSAQVPNHNVEVGALLYGSGINGGGDADPVLVAQDFLTNPQYGVGYPAGLIDGASWLSGPNAQTTGDASWQTFCRAIGFDFSPALTSQEIASSILQRWAQLTNTALFISGAYLKAIPYGDQPVTGNGYAFVPNVTPVYALTDADFVRTAGQDPVLLTRIDQTDAYNCVRLEYRERSNQYNVVTVESKDQNQIELYGLRVAATLQGNEITTAAVAQMACDLVLARTVEIRNTYTFKLSAEFFLLEPMDLVTLTDAGLGLNAAIVRVTTMEEDDTGVFTVTAEEFVAGSGTPTANPTQSLETPLVNSGAPADPVNPPIIFEPTASLSAGVPQVWVGISGGSGGVADPNWGGAQVWLSSDGVTYEMVGQVNAPSRMGVLTAGLPAFGGSGEDTADTLAIGVAESAAVLGSGTLAAAQAAQTQCYVDGEILSYVTATLTAANAYALTGLLRGQAGSSAGAHAVGSAFLRLDADVFKYDLPQSYVGVPLYLKLASFNIYGSAVQDLSACTAYSYTPAGTGYFIGAPR